MDPATNARLARLDEFAAKRRAATDALAAVVEDPELGGYELERRALLDALNWLELAITCGDCVEGRCHWGGEASQQSIAAAEAGRDYVHPGTGPCGCGRHQVSVQARQRHARLHAAGLLP